MNRTGLDDILSRDFIQPSERTAYQIVGSFLSDEREKDWEAIKRLQDKGFQVIAPKEWK